MASSPKSVRRFRLHNLVLSAALFFVMTAAFQNCSGPFSHGQLIAGSANGDPAGGGGSGGGDDSPTPTPAPTPGLSVHMGTASSPGHIVDASGTAVQFRGVNRSGAEYMCMGGWGFFDGPADQASIDAMKTWKVNTVRIPLNEDCWLGINGVSATYGGANYQAAITQYVQLLASNGLYAILDLHWSAAGTAQATSQAPMADADHSPLFWSQVATAFANQPTVIFDLFNEPYLDNDDWDCWLNGGTCSLASNASYEVAGMKSLYQAVRAAGANNLVIIGGMQDANDFQQWVSKVQQIPGVQNVAAAWHIYDFNSIQTGCPSQFNSYLPALTCNSAADTASNAYVDLVLNAGYPVVLGESGISPLPNQNLFTAQQIQYVETWYDNLFTWLDQKGQGYMAWAWNTDGGPMLIQDYTGTPTTYDGATVRAHYLRVGP